MKKNIIIGIMSFALAMSFAIIGFQYVNNQNITEKFENEISKQNENIKDQDDYIYILEGLVEQNYIFNLAVNYFNGKDGVLLCEFGYYGEGKDHIENLPFKEDSEGHLICPLEDFFNSDKGQRLIIIRNIQNLHSDIDSIASHYMFDADKQKVNDLYAQIEILEQQLDEINQKIAEEKTGKSNNESIDISNNLDSNLDNSTIARN